MDDIIKQERYDFWKSVTLGPMENFVLPDPKYNYGSWGTAEEQLQLIEEILIEEYKEYEDFSKEEISELKEDLKELKVKINQVEIAKEGLKKDKEPISQEPKESADKPINLFFATNTYGTVMIERDLKNLKRNIDKETYKSYLDLLEKLRDNPKNFKDEQQKSISNSNDKVKGLYELKDYQARIYYRYVGKDIVVIGAISKKVDWDRATQKNIENMYSHSELYITRLSEAMKSGKDLSSLVSENEKIYTRIIESGKGVGRK